MRLPYLTIALTLAALITAGLNLEPALQFDRDVIAAGEFHRLLTGHLAHWSFDHLLWDVLVYAALGAVAEALHRRRTLACLLASSLAISAAVWLFLPDMTLYRGLSGLDSALFALIAATILHQSLAERRRTQAAAAGLALLAILAKTLAELATGSAFFVDANAAGFIPVPLAHLVGALVGVATALWPTVALRLPRVWRTSNPAINRNSLDEDVTALRPTDDQGTGHGGAIIHTPA